MMILSRKRSQNGRLDKLQIFHFDSIGKTVFLTREEAEDALKELERGKGE